MQPGTTTHPSPGPTAEVRHVLSLPQACQIPTPDRGEKREKGSEDNPT